jgi:hypothetical protein
VDAARGLVGAAVWFPGAIAIFVVLVLVIMVMFTRRRRGG